ncbi:MAG TPA: glycosyltransferase family 4 protein, partial [Bacteroidia bacterium]|nr:glycosyltransferase family 4 protein [Bacteroidia bacterium]
GKMAAELIGKISSKHPKLYTTFLGPETKRYDILLPLQPNLQTKNIVVIATASSDFRVYYKGLDLMIKGFAIAHANDKNLRFYILGDFNEVNKKKLLTENTEEVNNAIIFTGNVSNIEDYFTKCSLYLHCSRGDAFPTSTTEAMIAGLPTIVSEWTGTKEIVEKVDPKFISQLNENDIAEKISWYFSLSLAEKNSYSIQFKEIAKDYNEKASILHYQNTFNEFIKDSSVAS